MCWAANDLDALTHVVLYFSVVLLGWFSRGHGGHRMKSHTSHAAGTGARAGTGGNRCARGRRVVQGLRTKAIAQPTGWRGYGSCVVRLDFECATVELALVLVLLVDIHIIST